MKAHLFFALITLLPLSAFAGLEGVYQGTFVKNGSQCEFNADIRNVKTETLTIEKWESVCDNGTSTSLNGPVTFSRLNNKNVEVVIDQEAEVYHAKTFNLNESSFNVNYDFDSFLEGTILHYDILFNMVLEKGVLTYKIVYKQNEQVIFKDEGSGNKLR